MGSGAYVALFIFILIAAILYYNPKILSSLFKFNSSNSSIAYSYFAEQGLPADRGWSIKINGTSYSSTQSFIRIKLNKSEHYSLSVPIVTVSDCANSSVIIEYIPNITSAQITGGQNITIGFKLYSGKCLQAI
jgi:hypothetical protein